MGGRYPQWFRDPRSREHRQRRTVHFVGRCLLVGALVGVVTSMVGPAAALPIIVAGIGVYMLMT